MPNISIIALHRLRLRANATLLGLKNQLKCLHPWSVQNMFLKIFCIIPNIYEVTALWTEPWVCWVFINKILNSFFSKIYFKHVMKHTVRKIIQIKIYQKIIQNFSRVWKIIVFQESWTYILTAKCVFHEKHEIRSRSP